jgi:hypothetical protein
MREQDRPQAQTALGEGSLHRSVFARIHHQGVSVIVVQQPDVIVGQGR